MAACIEANTEEKLSIIFQNCTENYLTDLKLDEDERRKISLLGRETWLSGPGNADSAAGTI